MVSKTLIEEVELICAMERHKLSLKEALQAMAEFANKKEFEKSLDDYYSNELVVDATQETITPDY
tara:strand:- start:1407 stop:1601 length:195 start_codon:yes stop_codon:yes gene_type:complete